MDSSTLLKIYGTLGAALFSFAFNLFWLERTGASILKQIVPHAKTPSAVLIGAIAICRALLAATRVHVICCALR